MRNSKTIFLPYPITKNKWPKMHWSARGRIKCDWENQVWAQVNTAPKMPKPVSRVVVDLVVYCHRSGTFPDPQNVTGMAHECIADGLVKAGVLEDDGPRKRNGYHAPYVEGTITLKRSTDRGPYTEATIRW